MLDGIFDIRTTCINCCVVSLITDSSLPKEHEKIMKRNGDGSSLKLKEGQLAETAPKFR